MIHMPEALSMQPSHPWRSGMPMNCWLLYVLCWIFKGYLNSFKELSLNAFYSPTHNICEENGCERWFSLPLQPTGFCFSPFLLEMVQLTLEALNVECTQPHHPFPKYVSQAITESTTDNLGVKCTQFWFHSPYVLHQTLDYKLGQIEGIGRVPWEFSFQSWTWFLCK